MIMASPQPQNTALFLDDTLKVSVKHDFPAPVPSDDEYLVEVLYSGVNPADIKHGYMGITNVVMGYDFSGKVVQVPKNAAHAPKFPVGSLVGGTTPTGAGRPTRWGTHQGHLAALEELMFLVPEQGNGSLTAAEAACLPVVVGTAADAVFNFFGRPLPGSGGGDDAATGGNNGPLLVWGAATSVGLSVVQLAKASGIAPIFVTASPARHELLLELGATKCFDYRDGDVVAKIKAAGELKFAIDAAGAPGGADSVLAAAEVDTILLSVVPQMHLGPRFQMPVALASRDVTIRMPAGGPPDGKGPLEMTVPARKEDSDRMWKVTEWVVENYGTGKGFKLPTVEVFDGSAEDALKELEMTVGLGRFGKLVMVSTAIEPSSFHASRVCRLEHIY